MEGGGDEARRRIDEIKFRNQGGNMEGIAGFNLEYNDDVPDPAEQDDVVVNRRRLESMDDMASLSPSRKHKGGSVVRNETYSFEAFIDPKQVCASNCCYCDAAGALRRALESMCVCVTASRRSPPHRARSNFGTRRRAQSCAVRASCRGGISSSRRTREWMARHCAQRMARCSKRHTSCG